MRRADAVGAAAPRADLAAAVRRVGDVRGAAGAARVRSLGRQSAPAFLQHVVAPAAGGPERAARARPLARPRWVLLRLHRLRFFLRAGLHRADAAPGLLERTSRCGSVRAAARRRRRHGRLLDRLLQRDVAALRAERPLLQQRHDGVPRPLRQPGISHRHHAAVRDAFAGSR